MTASESTAPSRRPTPRNCLLNSPPCESRLRPGTQAQGWTLTQRAAASASPIGYWSPGKPEAQALVLMGNVVLGRWRLFFLGGSNIGIGGETQVKTEDCGRWSRGTYFCIPTIPTSRPIIPGVQMGEGIVGVVVWSVVPYRISLLGVWGCACGDR